MIKPFTFGCFNTGRYLKRKIGDYLLVWAQDEDRKTLIIMGARQTGKTEAVRHFAKRYDNFVEINFALESKYRTICADGYDTESIISNISVINPSFRFIEHKTLIFFDEIQDYPEIATALKSFNEDRRFDCICSGSMLGINYKRIESNSVGNKSEYILESLDCYC